MAKGNAQVGQAAPAEPPLQVLEGTIERFTYQNPENGYTVARLQPKGKAYEVTAVGTLAGAAVGELVRLRGYWRSHPEYGRQFEVRAFSVSLPATIEGIRKYLGSGLIKGIGPVNASRIVDAFGLATLDVIESDPGRLRQVPGVGPKRAELIRKGWEEQRSIKEIMIFLQGQGIGTGLAVRIFKCYGNQALEVVQHDPYRLAQDVHGIGFKTADKVAHALGMPADSPQRIQAGLQHVLGTFCDEGHCFASQPQLIARAAELLEVPAPACQAQLAALIAREALIAENDAVYLPAFHQAEVSVARKLRLLQSAARDRLAQFRGIDWTRAFAWLQQQSALTLVQPQMDAVRMALSEKVSILTGGPGTGKSTIVGSLIALLAAKQGSVLLAAPTGRAAKRLSETSGLEARTIHRLLEYNPGATKAFVRDRDNPLDADLIIVDEASMIDILLMNHLLRAVEAGSHLLLVGDVDQLPSVGPGNVLRDLIASEVIPVTRLTTIFRQAAGSAIVANAHRINRGEAPLTSREIHDFYMFREPDPARAADLVIDLVARRIPGKFGLDRQEGIQVLSPMHRGAAGVGELNRRLQERLNPPAPSKPEVAHGARTFRLGDRVMQVRNNYDKKVFNGDLGRVAAVDLEDKTLAVDFDSERVEYEFLQLDELAHAYAASVHKAQGCEFPAVVIPLLNQHYLLLQRNLLYTGVTRARQLVVLVGSPKAVAMAVRNDRIAKRNTRLAQRMREAAPEPAQARYRAAP
ncbi:MAG TPA: ATP-dependent RecD-like DNA helicase [Anaerolineae bacterium]|nr:ATP-dependent RecD-like DNA helicase [Anaerolineae bacterium]